MKFRDAQPGQRVRFGGMDFTIKEHVKGTRPIADVTVCTYENPRLQNPENTFCSDLECEPISDNAQNHQHRGVPEIEGVAQLRGDDREGRAGAPAVAGVQASHEAEPQIS
jgi:hypothetical protein